MGSWQTKNASRCPLAWRPRPRRAASPGQLRGTTPPRGAPSSRGFWPRRVTSDSELGRRRLVCKR
eukprot:444201-Pyramimonas_sp.AAC.1